MRAFLAVHFSAEIVRRIVRMQELLSDPMKRLGIRATSERNIHMTLAFIGELEATRVSSLQVGLSDALQGGPAPIIRFGSIGLMGCRAGSRVLVAEVHSTPELIALSQAVRGVLDRNGIEYDRKPFRGHVTIGRSRDEVSRQSWEALTKGFGLPQLPDGVAQSVELVKSELSTPGPSYGNLFSIKLA